ncbi:MAG: L-rhamnose/proton symporter RhaT [Saprospiraceae bacterium]
MGSILGVILHAIGGFAAGSFYIPIKKVKGWQWETSWMILGIMAWIIAPAVVAILTVHQPIKILVSIPSDTFLLVFVFGLLWGIGGLTFGLSMRYLGISLGMTVALGLCTAFGTLIPPIFKGEFSQLISTPQGIITLLGIALCLFGIVVVGYAGMLKEKAITDSTNPKAIEEFHFKKGIFVAIISGILSACFAFGLEAGKPIADFTSSTGTLPIFHNNMILVCILWGGMATNGLYSLYLNKRKYSFHDYNNASNPLLKNYLWAMLGGLTWYLQFFFYGMGTTFIGQNFEFASWSIHMAFIILFSNIWGIYFNEWKNANTKIKTILLLGLGIILIAIVLIGMAGFFVSLLQN